MVAPTVPNSSILLDSRKQGRILSHIPASCWVYSVGRGGQLALFPVFSLWQRTVCRNQVLSHDSNKVGSSLYLKLACIVCTESVPCVGAESQNTSLYLYNKISGFPQHREWRVIFKAWHLAATETFCTIFPRSKALGKAAAVGLLYGSPSFERHEKTDDSWFQLCPCWKSIELLVIKCPGLSFSVSSKCFTPVRGHDCKCTDENGARQGRLIRVKKHGQIHVHCLWLNLKLPEKLWQRRKEKKYFKVWHLCDVFCKINNTATCSCEKQWSVLN